MAPPARLLGAIAVLALCFASSVSAAGDYQAILTRGSLSRRELASARHERSLKGVEELLELGEGEWPYKCPVAPVPEGFDETIKIEHLLHHAAAIQAKYGYAKPPHIILVDDSRETCGGLTDMDPDDVPFNTMLSVKQLPEHWGWGVNADLLLWDKDEDEGSDSWEDAVVVLHQRVLDMRKAGYSVHVVFDWDNTLHSGGGWTSGKINKWRESDNDWEDRDPSGLDELNPHLLQYALSGTEQVSNVTFGVATHNSFHKGDDREEEDVFAADLVLYWFHLVAEEYGTDKFEVVTSGRPDRTGGSVNLWVPIGEVENGLEEFCLGPSESSPPAIEEESSQEEDQWTVELDELLELGEGEWPYKCPVAPVPEGFDETIKIEHLLHHAAAIQAKYGYAKPPHIILVDDSRETCGGLTNMDPDDVPFNTMLSVKQLPEHWGWGVNADLLLWDKDEDEGSDSWEDAVVVLHQRVLDMRKAGYSVHVVFDWDNTLHSGGGWTSGKINKWRESDNDWEDRDPSGLDELNPHLLQYALSGTQNIKNVTFGVATHNSFHKGDDREEEDVFAADLVLYWFHLVAEEYGTDKFEVVTSGRPDRTGGSVNLWVPIGEVVNGLEEFCSVTG